MTSNNHKLKGRKLFAFTPLVAMAVVALMLCGAFTVVALSEAEMNDNAASVKSKANVDEGFAIQYIEDGPITCPASCTWDKNTKTLTLNDANIQYVRFFSAGNPDKTHTLITEAKIVVNGDCHIVGGYRISDFSDTMIGMSLPDVSSIEGDGTLTIENCNKAINQDNRSKTGAVNTLTISVNTLRINSTFDGTKGVSARIFYGIFQGNASERYLEMSGVNEFSVYGENAERGYGIGQAQKDSKKYDFDSVINIENVNMFKVDMKLKCDSQTTSDVGAAISQLGYMTKMDITNVPTVDIKYADVGYSVYGFDQESGFDLSLKTCNVMNLTNVDNLKMDFSCAANKAASTMTVDGIRQTGGNNLLNIGMTAVNITIGNIDAYRDAVGICQTKVASSMVGVNNLNVLDSGITFSASWADSKATKGNFTAAVFQGLHYYEDPRQKPAEPMEMEIQNNMSINNSMLLTTFDGFKGANDVDKHYYTSYDIDGLKQAGLFNKMDITGNTSLDFEFKNLSGEGAYISGIFQTCHYITQDRTHNELNIEGIPSIKSNAEWNDAINGYNSGTIYQDGFRNQMTINNVGTIDIKYEHVSASMMGILQYGEWEETQNRLTISNVETMDIMMKVSDNEPSSNTNYMFAPGYVTAIGQEAMDDEMNITNVNSMKIDVTMVSCDDEYKLISAICQGYFNNNEYQIERIAIDNIGSLDINVDSSDCQGQTVGICQAYYSSYADTDMKLINSKNVTIKVAGSAPKAIEQIDPSAASTMSAPNNGTVNLVNDKIHVILDYTGNQMNAVASAIGIYASNVEIKDCEELNIEGAGTGVKGYKSVSLENVSFIYNPCTDDEVSMIEMNKTNGRIYSDNSTMSENLKCYDADGNVIPFASGEVVKITITEGKSHPAQMGSYVNPEPPPTPVPEPENKNFGVAVALIVLIVLVIGVGFYVRSRN